MISFWNDKHLDVKGSDGWCYSHSMNIKAVDEMAVWNWTGHRISFTLVRPVRIAGYINRTPRQTI